LRGAIGRRFAPTRWLAGVAAIGAVFFVTEAAFSARLALLAFVDTVCTLDCHLCRISVVDAARSTQHPFTKPDAN
jgi:hypothetical protein